MREGRKAAEGEGHLNNADMELKVKPRKIMLSTWAIDACAPKRDGSRAAEYLGGGEGGSRAGGRRLKNAGTVLNVSGA